ncbi:hypothetical protein F383_11931 [Gossypium arboreum]|uniref:Uncharacterized protein n=1 Tax=Gossypium arboreum TaxID=29729 RepID=A0A0B0Q1Y2_GOSAR|nr:hypothetical protein F383_11931 [Gossypium arboreum]
MQPNNMVHVVACT